MNITIQGVTMMASSTQGIKTVLHPVSDRAKAKKVSAVLLQGMTSPVATVTDPDGNVLGLIQDRCVP